MQGGGHGPQTVIPQWRRRTRRRIQRLRPLRPHVSHSLHMLLMRWCWQMGRCSPPARCPRPRTPCIATQTRANAAAVSQIQCWHAEQRSVYGCPGQRSAIRANSSCARADLRRHHKHHKREQNGRCQPPARCVDRERGPRHSPDNHPAGHVGALSLYVSSRLYTAGCVLAARMQATMMDSDDSRQ